METSTPKTSRGNASVLRGTGAETDAESARWLADLDDEDGSWLALQSKLFRQLRALGSLETAGRR